MHACMHARQPRHPFTAPLTACSNGGSVHDSMSPRCAHGHCIANAGGRWVILCLFVNDCCGSFLHMHTPIRCRLSGGPRPGAAVACSCPAAPRQLAHLVRANNLLNRSHSRPVVVTCPWRSGGLLDGTLRGTNNRIVSLCLPASGAAMSPASFEPVQPFWNGVC